MLAPAHPASSAGQLGLFHFPLGAGGGGDVAFVERDFRSRHEDRCD